MQAVTPDAGASSAPPLDDRLLKPSGRLKREAVSHAARHGQDTKADTLAPSSFAKHAAFQTAFLLGNPPLRTGFIWNIERFIMFLQVRAVCALRRTRRCCNGYCILNA